MSKRRTKKTTPPVPRADPFKAEREEMEELARERELFGSGELTSTLDPVRRTQPETFLSSGETAAKGIPRERAKLKK